MKIRTCYWRFVCFIYPILRGCTATGIIVPVALEVTMQDVVGVDQTMTKQNKVRAMCMWLYRHTSMAYKWCQTAVSPLLTHWIYHNLALNHQNLYIYLSISLYIYIMYIYMYICIYIFFRENFLALDIYYDELAFESITQSPAYTVINFFSKYDSLILSDAVTHIRQ